MKKILLAAAMSGLFASPVGAAFLDGNTLLARCTSTEAGARDFCVGYVGGAIDMAQDAVVCVPGNFTIRQGVDMVVQALRDVPAVRSQPADAIIVAVVGRVFPCEKKQSNPSARTL